MAFRGTSQRPSTAQPEGTESLPEPIPRRNYGRWRAISLSLVYLVFAAHIIHWKTTGKTLAPLELNEVMYTLELGIITAGFLFMCFLVFGTMVFGRFFCSWACHILVLQDACAWILRKIGIRQKPIRSRLLLWVPPFTALYMFVWPQLLRAWEHKAFPTFHMRTDAEGWASFMTHDYWRNLPSIPVIALTFLVCGFVIVYVLGSRTFCTYVCPYGAIFALADRFSPGRILLTGACRQCGTCTAACSSGIRVHEEVNRHGKVVNPACMKDLDCVSACPQGALQYGFAKPAFFASSQSGGRFGRSYDFSWPEECVAALVFLISLFSFRGLYGRVPFLLSLALGGVFGVFAVAAVRMATRPNVKLASLSLKRQGMSTAMGRTFVGLVAGLALLVGHSALIRYHEFRGLSQGRWLTTYESAEAGFAMADSARGHLLLADKWGLLRNERVERSIIAVSLRLRRFEDAETYALRLLRRHPDDASLHLQLGRSLLAQQKSEDAEREFRTVVDRWNVAVEQPSTALASAHELLAGLFARRNDFTHAAEELRATVALDPDRATAHAELGSALAEMGRFGDAIASLREARRVNPALGHVDYNLGTILAHLERFGEAIPYYRRALAIDPNDADVHNNLGYALLRTGSLEQSREQFESAIALDANHADAHFNLGAVFRAEGQDETAVVYFRRAAELDPRYARWLGQTHSQ